MRREETTSGQKLNVLAGLLQSISRPWRLFCTRPGTPGWREVYHYPGMFFGLGPLFIMALGSNSQMLKIVFAVGVFSQLEHMWRVKRQGVPSRFAGDMQLLKLFRTNERARKAEAVLAVVIGFLLWDVRDERLAAWWFILAGIGDAFTFRLAYAKQAHTDQDILDAQSDGLARSQRLQGRV